MSSSASGPRLIVANGRAWSPGRGVVGTAVGIEDGRIAATGDLADVRDRLPGAAELDAGGGLVHPAFVDAHVHLGIAAAESAQLDLSTAGSAEECLTRIAAYAGSTTDPWVRGGGWRAEWFPEGRPDRVLLDRAVADRPAFFLDSDHHQAWVNSAALAAAGLDRTTPDPADGVVERDADGAPTGLLREGASQLVAAIMPAPPVGLLAEGLVAAARELLAHGITGWQEAALGSFGGVPDVTDAYLRALGEGGLRGRPTGAVWVARGLERDDVDDAVDSLVARAERATAGGLATTTAKIMLDGIIESRTARLHRPYRGGGRGLRYVPVEVLVPLVAALNARGLAVHIHAIGDAATTQALDAAAAARRSGVRLPAGRRNHIAHLQLITPSDIPRFAAEDVVANVQPVWAAWNAAMRSLTEPLLGPERAARQFAFGDLVRARAPLAMGSDWPVSSLDPWQGIAVAVTRRSDPDEPAALGHHQELTLETALTAYTRGSAELLELGGGTLEVGAVADLAIADVDPFALPAEELSTVRTAATVLGGEVVHEAAATPRRSARRADSARRAASRSASCCPAPHPST